MNKYLLTYSMVQSPSWEANWFAASQEIPHISRNPKVHYRTHKRSPPLSILGQPNPVHIPTSHLLEIHPNIIHPSTPRSPQWSPTLRFPHQDPIHPPLLTHMCHMSSPWRRITIYKLKETLICLYALVGLSSYPISFATAVAQWLRCCATNRKVAGSIPDGVIGIFHGHKILPIALWPWGRLSL